MRLLTEYCARKHRCDEILEDLEHGRTKILDNSWTAPAPPVTTTTPASPLSPAFSIIKGQLGGMLARLRTVIPIVLKSPLGGLARKMPRLARACTGLARGLHGACTGPARRLRLPARSLHETFGCPRGACSRPFCTPWQS